MKKIILILLISCSAFYLSAQENTSKDKNAETEANKENSENEDTKTENKPKIGVEIKERVDFQTSGTEVESAGFGWYGDALYNRTELKAKTSWKIGDFCLTPWTKERLELRLNFNGELPIADDQDTVLLRGRNRFYLGFDFNYNYKKMKFGLDNEIRIENDLKPGKTSNSVDVRYAPVIKLSGKHDFGLYWEMNQLIGFHFNPSSFDEYDLDGTYKLGYKVWKKEIYSISIDSWEHFRWRKDKLDNTDARTRGESETYLGISFDLGGFKPFAGYYMWYDNEIQGSSEEQQLICGINTGLKYSGKNFELSASYKGGSDIFTPDSPWLGDISTQVKLKF